MGEALDLLRLPVVRIEVELAVAVGEEIHRLADPHGLGVIAASGRLGDLLVRQVIQLEDPDPRRRSAAIVLPLPEALAERRIGQQLAVGRDGPHVARGDRQATGDSAIDTDREELRMPAREGRALRAEEHLAVGREAADDVVAGMPGQPRRLAPLGGDHVDVVVAVVAGREGDVLAVGREIRVLLLAGVRRHPPGILAVGIGHPDVVGIGERDLPFGDRRRGQQPRVRCVERRAPIGTSVIANMKAVTAVEFQGRPVIGCSSVMVELGEYPRVRCSPTCPDYSSPGRPTRDLTPIATIATRPRGSPARPLRCRHREPSASRRRSKTCRCRPGGPASRISPLFWEEWPTMARLPET